MIKLTKRHSRDRRDEHREEAEHTEKMHKMDLTAPSSGIQWNPDSNPGNLILIQPYPVLQTIQHSIHTIPYITTVHWYSHLAADKAKDLNCHKKH